MTGVHISVGHLWFTKKNDATNLVLISHFGESSCSSALCQNEIPISEIESKMFMMGSNPAFVRSQITCCVHVLWIILRHY